MIGRLQHKARSAMRRSLAGIAGGVALLVGCGFLTASAFLVLSELRDAVFASAVIGGAYAGLGLIVIAIASRSGRGGHEPLKDAERRMAQTPEHANFAELPPLAAAFSVGLSAGLDAGRARH